jgi:hypothetical protein
MKGRLDIGDTFRMVTGNGSQGLMLRPDRADWCREVLGYVPVIEMERSGESPKWVHLVFKHEDDPTLFYINFAALWKND